MELVLVRHAQVSDEALGRCYGRLDFDLSEAGQTQCRRLAVALAGSPVAAVVSSPRGRAHLTAAAIAEPHGLPVLVVDDLRELDFGELEGESYDEIAASRPELYRQWMADPTAVRFPGGEAYSNLEARVGETVYRLRRTYHGRTVIAITHAGAIRAVLAEALGLPRDRIFSLDVDTGSVSRVEWRDGVAVVRSVNVSP